MTRSAAVPTTLLALTLLSSGCGYNTIQTMDERINQAKGQIETQLQRRADLVPNLVETVKGIAKQESTVFTSIAESRARLAVTAEVTAVDIEPSQWSAAARASPR